MVVSLNQGERQVGQTTVETLVVLVVRLLEVIELFQNEGLIVVLVVIQKVGGAHPCRIVCSLVNITQFMDRRMCHDEMQAMDAYACDQLKLDGYIETLYVWGQKSLWNHIKQR